MKRSWTKFTKNSESFQIPFILRCSRLLRK